MTKRFYRDRWIKRGIKPPVPATSAWQELVAEIDAHHQRKSCGALGWRGWPCEAAALPHGRCAKHKEDRYTGSLAGHELGDLYALARTDPNLLALTEEIALLVSKQKETLSKLQAGGSATDWTEACAAFDELDGAWRGGNLKLFTASFERLATIMHRGVGEVALWQEYEARLEVLRRLVDTERKYQEAMRLYIPLVRANAIMGVWLECIQQVIPQEYVVRLHEEFQRRRPQIAAAQAEGSGKLTLVK